MKEKNTERAGESRLAWAGLEAFAREGVHPVPGSRKGLGKPRRGSGVRS